MNIPVGEMRQRLRLLGLKEPTSLALLPLNFDTASGANELHYATISKEIESLLQRNGTAVDLLDSTEDRLYVDNRASDLFLPVLIFTRQFISEHPDVISVTLDLLAYYLKSKFEKLTSRPKVRLRYLRESDDAYELIEYNGPVEGLSEVIKLKPKNDKRKTT
jgi:hypothetical protein